MSPFMLLLWHMPCMFTTLVPRWREAAPTLTVSETTGVDDVGNVNGGQLLESVPPLGDSWLCPTIGLGCIKALPAGWDLF